MKFAILVIHIDYADRHHPIVLSAHISSEGTSETKRLDQCYALGPSHVSETYEQAKAKLMHHLQIDPSWTWVLRFLKE